MERKFDLLETHFSEPWQVLVTCMLLNRTSRKQVDRVIYKLFDGYHSAYQMSRAETNCLIDIIRPLGFQNRRATALQKMSSTWLELSNPTVEQVSKLPGVGKYALDSYRIFILNDYSVVPEDYALKNYLKHRQQPFEVCPECFKVLQCQEECRSCDWVHPNTTRRRNEMRYNVEARVATTINEKVVANSPQEAVDFVKQKYNRMESSSKLHPMEVEVSQVQEDPQMAFDFPELHEPDYQPALLFG